MSFFYLCINQLGYVPPRLKKRALKYKVSKKILLAPPMKKTLFWLACLLQFSSWLYALPLGNPLAPELLGDGICTPWCFPSTRISAGFYGDYVFNRHMRVSNIPPERQIRQFKILTNAGIINVDFFQRASLFATLGASQITIQSPRAAFFNSLLNNIVFLEANTAFSWSIGGRGILWNCGCLAFGLESQYFATRPTLNYLRTEGLAPLYFNKRGLQFRDFQIGFGASYSYQLGCTMKLSPYAGFEWSRAHLHSEGANRDLLTNEGISYFLRNFESSRDLGFCLGLSLVLYEAWIGTVEAHFADQTAMSVDVRAKF